MASSFRNLSALYHRSRYTYVNFLWKNHSKHAFSTVGEPDGPIVKTSIPGPRSNSMLSHMKEIQISEYIQKFKKYSERTKGCSIFSGSSKNYHLSRNFQCSKLCYMKNFSYIKIFWQKRRTTLLFEKEKNKTINFYVLFSQIQRGSVFCGL